jgi:glycerophosphoryl diester phosphodiesterase
MSAPYMPRIIAHRGASALEMENTLAAFRRARADGADAVELDVQQCRTGELVVFHDDDLARLGGRNERVCDLPWAALAGVRLESGDAIPTLSQVIEEVGRDLLLHIELKVAFWSTGCSLARAVVDLLARRSGGLRALVSSFHPAALGCVRVLSPSLATGLLFEEGQAQPLREAWLRACLRPAALHPQHSLVTKARLGQWRREGYAVNVWTVDDEAELGRLAALGVDGVITNHPARARDILAKRR